METKFCTIEQKAPEAEVIAQAGQIIKDGGLVAFPTETVYGLGGDAFNKESSKKIYAAKGRPSDNPLIVHIAKVEDLEKVAKDIPEEAYILAGAFWPGPLTMVLPKREEVPKETTGGLDTVAVRLPDHPVALPFIEAAGGFVAAPSANASGRPSPTTALHVKEDLEGRIEMILDGGEVGIGVESTIVDLTGDKPMILRPGFVTEEMLLRVLGDVETDQTIMLGSVAGRPKAPGMKYRHYAPKGSLVLLEGSPEKVLQAMQEKLAAASAKGKKTGVLCSTEIAPFVKADVVIDVGSRQDEASIARHLYGALRQFDTENVTEIFGESFSREGFGAAVMNRLLKAAGYSVESL